MKILICENDALLLANLLNIGAEGGFETDGAPDGFAALEKASVNSYGILVTDIRMPGMSGIDLLGKFKELSPETKVVVITGHASVEYAVACLKHGASDFLLKPFSKEDFLDSLNGVAGQEAKVVISGGGETDQIPPLLTGREKEVLGWARDGKNNWEIARILNISEATAKYHMGNILKKLSVANRAAAVARAIQEKLI